MESRPSTPQVVAHQSNDRQQHDVPVSRGTSTLRSEQSSGLPFDDVFNFQLVLFEVSYIQLVCHPVDIDLEFWYIHLYLIGRGYTVSSSQKRI